MAFESDATDAAELRVRHCLVQDGRSVDIFPLVPLPGRPDPDGLVNGVKTCLLYTSPSPRDS